jgi:regulator of sirC expression with transglutaminase-like and TPR domain
LVWTTQVNQPAAVNNGRKQSFTPVLMGHEVQEHLQGKQAVAGFWIRRGFTVVLEAGCDALAWKVDQERFNQVFNAFERHTKHVLNNCARNQRHARAGARHLIVVPNGRMRAAVRRMLRQGLPAESSRKVGIALLSRLH